jgi:hypothetical protein
MRQTNSCRCVRGNSSVSSSVRDRHKHDRLAGLAEDGTFKTAPTKQYQPPMCSLMARGIIKNAAKRISPAGIDWASFQESHAFRFFVPLDPYLEAHAFGHYASDNAARLAGNNSSNRTHHGMYVSSPTTWLGSIMYNSHTTNQVVTPPHAPPVRAVGVPTPTPEVQAAMTAHRRLRTESRRSGQSKPASASSQSSSHELRHIRLTGMSGTGK